MTDPPCYVSFRPLEWEQEDEEMIQDKLIHLIIALCAGTFVCIILLMVIVAVLTWSRRKKGLFKVQPGQGPVR